MKNKCNATTCSNLEISESAFKRWLKMIINLKEIMKRLI